MMLAACKATSARSGATEVVSAGYQEGAIWHGNVYLKGFGDPTLTSLQLARLAAQLKQQGILQIDGRVVGDDTWFDSVRTAAGWKSSFYLYESPPLSALAVDHGVYAGNIGRKSSASATRPLNVAMSRPDP